MPDKPRLLLIHLVDLKNNPRPYKQVRCLQDYFEITEVALGPSGCSRHFFQVTDITRGRRTWPQKIYVGPPRFCAGPKHFLKSNAVRGGGGGIQAA
jgi:hypothetical protein